MVATITDTTFVNLKAEAKDIWDVGLFLYKVVGDEIGQGLMKEFEILVRETAQYTGSTAASWNIDAAPVPADGRVRIQFLPPGANPLAKGHGIAVGLSLHANKDNLKDLYRKTKTFGINVWNESPGAISGVPEYGPLRDVNKGAEGAFARFQDRVRNRVFRPLKGVTDVKSLKRKAQQII